MFQSNNADFRGTDENLQQLAFARMRAVETGRAVINVGTSQVIGPDGAITASLGVDTAGATVSTVPLRTGLTAATVIGPWLTTVIMIVASGALAALGLSHRAGSRTAKASSRRRHLPSATPPH